MPENAMAMAEAERRDFLEFLETLTPEQWKEQSLCTAWSVRDVVAHMISYEGLSPGELLRGLAKARFLPSRINDVMRARYAQAGPEKLIDALGECLVPSGLTKARGGGIALLDCMIHHQDVRRPLGRPREIPADRLRAALRLAMSAPPLGTPPRRRGLRLVAEDVDWSFGKGPEVRGNGEALLLAIAGRRGIVDELSGDGRATLAARTKEGG